jgi:hypothetical protein
LVTAHYYLALTQQVSLTAQATSTLLLPILAHKAVCLLQSSFLRLLDRLMQLDVNLHSQKVRLRAKRFQMPLLTFLEINQGQP